MLSKAEFIFETSLGSPKAKEKLKNKIDKIKNKNKNKKLK